MGDFLHDLLEAVSAAVYEGPHELWQLELQLRREHGGRRFYIRATAPNTATGSPGSLRSDAAPPGGTSTPTR